MALDTGEVESVADGYALFEGYRVNIVVGEDVATSRAHQAALLTMVNAGRRSLLGGVHVVGALDVPLLVALPGIDTSLSEAVVSLGGMLTAKPCDGSPTIILGEANNAAATGAPSIVATFDDWRGGVGPVGEFARLSEGKNATLGAILAAAIAISETFQCLRGYVLAARRIVGMSLWNPGALDWQADEGAPAIHAAPSRLWLMGLGHLGQAYLWTLALLNFEDPAEVEITLQDYDKLTAANDSTSMLTTLDRVGQYKTRVVAEWLEARGFRTRIVERMFDGDLRLSADDPQVVLCGVDNLEARAALDEAGFKLVIEAGLGAGPDEYVTARVHCFPASVTSRSKWGGLERDRAKGDGRAYDNLVESGAVDACGLVQLATRTVGAPFVGLTAACLVISELVRRLHGGPEIEVVDISLKTPRQRTMVPSAQRIQPWSYGFAELRLADLFDKPACRQALA
ncbi:ThiF family adenylyltransferase [Ensifer sp. ENS04]|uniref:ThiF family adenylyltransferase n=1 Tax=Ensifer sp. ENS04 TaxID=2769281 RepID=UPI001785810C|nr:ThiF family adenylyltransferase [Ensifer sp. ENS04]MBD9544861.1 ThiF family adenylyltransferase [Ensifer sp. ENS04]